MTPAQAVEIEIQAPESYLFGSGVVTISRGLDKDGPEQRSCLILRENWSDSMPVREVIPPEHPNYFSSPITPTPLPDRTTTLWFENPLGIQNLIHELIALHALRYPGVEIRGVSLEVVAAVLAERNTSPDALIFGRFTPELS